MNKIKQLIELFVNESDSQQLNKGKVKRLIQAGGFIGRVKSNYTDDYAYDDKTNYGKTDWFPVELSSDGSSFGSVKDGKLLIDEKWFSDKNVRATVNSDAPTIINLALHHFKYLELKDKKETSFYVTADMSSHEVLPSEYLYVLAIIYSKTSSYRPKFLQRVENLATVLEDLQTKGYVSKTNSLTKQGQFYLKSLDRTTLEKTVNDYAKSNQIMFSFNMF